MMSLRTQRLPLYAKFTSKVVVKAGVKDTVDAGMVRKIKSNSGRGTQH